MDEFDDDMPLADIEGEAQLAKPGKKKGVPGWIFLVAGLCIVLALGVILKPLLMPNRAKKAVTQTVYDATAENVDEGLGNQPIVSPKNNVMTSDFDDLLAPGNTPTISPTSDFASKDEVMALTTKINSISEELNKGFEQISIHQQYVRDSTDVIRQIDAQLQQVVKALEDPSLRQRAKENMMAMDKLASSDQATDEQLSGVKPEDKATTDTSTKNTNAGARKNIAADNRKNKSDDAALANSSNLTSEYELVGISGDSAWLRSKESKIEVRIYAGEPFAGSLVTEINKSGKYVVLKNGIRIQ